MLCRVLVVLGLVLWCCSSVFAGVTTFYGIDPGTGPTDGHPEERLGDARRPFEIYAFTSRKPRFPFSIAHGRRPIGAGESP